ncbi:MAG: glutathione peroxidase [Flavobacteriales bacterium]|nr:glutathione peroxidase [Flavobacteriales bacterium]
MKILNLCIALATLPLANALNGQAAKSIYDIAIKTIDGRDMSLSELKGKHILFVNVASKCGYTKQYDDLQALHEKYKNDLVLIGLPCNQFGGQEPGTEAEIQAFCRKNYGVDFLMTEKIKVKGEGQHPLYQWLTNKELNGVEDSKVKWNFNKYLVSPDGKYIAHFGSSVKPLSEDITSILE